MMQINFCNTPSETPRTQIIFAFEGEALTGAAAIVESQLGDRLAHLREVRIFTGKAGETLHLAAPMIGEVDDLFLVGLGQRDKASARGLRNSGGKLAQALNGQKIRSAALLCDGLKTDNLSNSDIAAYLASGVKLKNTPLKTYRREEEDEEPPVRIESLDVVVGDAEIASQRFAAEDAVNDGILLARDLSAEPPNILYPERYAQLIEETAPEGLKVRILDDAAMEALNMNALLTVGRGSTKASRLVVMEWRGAEDPDAPPTAFIGKGVTFDSGGISIKPAKGMEEMKYDMAGSAAVVGLMQALARRKAKANIVGIVGLVENMPAGDAARPGDVITSASGKTIEVINTDAEGRLVLADALWYARETYKPARMIDLATLTGGILISLGAEYAGLFSNDDALATELLTAGTASDDKLWRLPLHAGYDRKIKSSFADIMNSAGPHAQSITAAQFLQHFVGDTPWAHLDICGTAWKAEPGDLHPKGPTGYGVRLLDAWVRINVEEARDTEHSGR